MTLSPLEFAREFEKLKGDLARLSASDVRLRWLLRFWPQMEPRLHEQSHESFLTQYSGWWIKNLDQQSLVDMTPDELSAVHSVTVSLGEADSTPNNGSALDNAMRLVVLRLATAFLYVGEDEQALKHLAALSGADEVDISKAPDVSNVAPLEALRQIHEHFRKADPDMAELVHGILSQWEADTSQVRHDRVWCLFVDKNHAGDGNSGRMHLLTGAVEQIDGKKKTGAGIDQVTHQNQAVTPDDPFIGVVYESLKAVRLGLRGAGFAKRADGAYRAFLSIEGSTRTFTGDSIGLAAALVSFTQLLHPEVMRHDRFIASDVAVTGSITADGKIGSVNDSTIAAKIERAFFSHVRYAVVPETNATTARAALERLHTRHPHRHLRLITASCLDDVIDDRNVISSEKVCIGEFVARKAYTYSRATKLQVPLLLGLVWLLLAFVAPKHFDPWFDWKIYDIEIMGDKFKTLNADGQTLWVSEELGGVLTPEAYDTPLKRHTHYHAVDIDGDARDELWFTPVLRNRKPVIQFYNSSGDKLWEKKIFQITSYPGDIQYEDIDAALFYKSGLMYPFVDKNGDWFVMTTSFASQPGRHQLLCFDTEGNIVSGPYIHTGSVKFYFDMWVDLNKDGRRELIGAGVNNRYEGASIVAVDPLNLSGVSPPFENDLFQMSGMPKGSQIRYVHIPETPLSAGPEIRNSVLQIQYNSENGSFEVWVAEGYALVIDGVLLTTSDDCPGLSYDLDSNFIPDQVYFHDGSVAQMNDLLTKLGREPIDDRQKLLDSLKSEVVVYHGDSIVHHEAAGIYFYSDK